MKTLSKVFLQAIIASVSVIIISIVVRRIISNITISVILIICLSDIVYTVILYILKNKYLLLSIEFIKKRLKKVKGDNE